MFCCRFKTAEIASTFQRAFIEATELAADYEKQPPTEVTNITATPSVSLKPLSELFKKPSGSWECDACLVNNGPDATECIACKAPNPKIDPASSDTAVKNNSSSALSTFKFGLSPAAASSLPPKASGSITLGLSSSGMFGTPTTTSTTGKGGFFSLSTPISTEGTTQNTGSASLFGSSSIFATPEVDASSASFGTPLAGVSTISKTSLFGTPTAGSSSFFSASSEVSTSTTTASTASFSNVSSATTTTTSSSKLSFGGFLFTTTPSVVKPSDKEDKTVASEPKKESIFSSITFGAPANSTNEASSLFPKNDIMSSTIGSNKGSPGLFSNVTGGLTFSALNSSSSSDPSQVFKTKDTEAFKPKPLFGSSSASTSINASKAEESSEHVEEYEPEIEFEPVIPLPELIQVKTGQCCYDQPFSVATFALTD